MPDAEIGVPYPDGQTGSVDAWSEGIYRALRDWRHAREGEWTRWTARYVLLTIERLNGERVEPIVLYTADEELTISFGGWVTHNPAPYELWDSGPDVIAEHGKTLVERWLNGELRTAYFYGASGQWCGSTLLEPCELTPQLKAAARKLQGFDPTHAEVRTPKRDGWRSHPVQPDWFASR